ncbi:MAG: TOBE domain-containing protein, partial [Pseudonocardia sp.]
PTETTNVVAVRLAAIEPLGNTMRLLASAPDGGEPWIDGLSADVTPATVVELGAEPGVDLWFHVNPAEVAIYAATG